MTVKEVVDGIGFPYKDSMAIAKEKQNKLAKPLGSLGKLEDISIKIAGITGNVKNDIKKKRVVVFCADNGISEENVTVSPRCITMLQALNIAKGKSGVSAIASCFGTEVSVVDVGIYDCYECRDIVNCKISRGTANFLKEDAVSRENIIKAVEVGINQAFRAKEDCVDVLGAGEMGIGNTTTASAVLSVITGCPVKDVTGYGGGISERMLFNKIKTIELGISLRKPNKDDVFDILSKVGGLDIASMCGLYLGAAYNRIPVVIDGFISCVAALCAYKIEPKVLPFIFASHLSAEPGYNVAIKELGLDTYLNLGMHLGEGSGCPLAFEIIESACSAINKMTSFGEEFGIDDSYTKNNELQNR